MKCNTLSKGCSTYYKKLKTLIPVKGKYEKQFLNNIFENLDGICSEQPDISYDELCNRIGTPTDLIIEYYENADAEYVIQKLHISSIIRNIVITILLIAVVVASIELYSFHKLYTQAPEKFDEDYAETAQGKSWTLPEGTKAQFVRVYMYGRKDNATTTNHVVELEVYGTKPEEGEKPGVDITALIDRLAELSAVDTSNATTDSAAAFKALVKEGYDLVATGAQTQEEVTAMIEKLKGAEDKLVAHPL